MVVLCCVVVQYRFGVSSSRDTFILCLVNGGSSFLAGFAIFSVLGFMSYEQGVAISEVAATGKATS